MKPAPFTPGAEVEWDLLPPAQGVQRGMVDRVVGGTVHIKRLRRNRSGRIVVADLWFAPYEVDRLRIVGGAR